MRTVAAGITTHLAGTAHTRCTMLRLDLKDGSTLAITDHDRDISFDLGDGAVTYSASTGILPSDLALSTGFEADDIEAVGPVTTTGLTTLPALLGGRFDDATARVFQVNWNSLTDGAIKLLKGWVAQVSVEGGKFRLTIHSEITRFQQEVGRTITAYCDADFGDARCGFVIVPVTATVTTVMDARTFTVSLSGTYANDYFNKGTVTFTGGAMSGCRPVEIYSWTSGGVIETWTDLVQAPAVGDTLQLKQGCGKTRADCMGFANIVNFRAFADVPGSDQVLKFPNPAG